MTDIVARLTAADPAAEAALQRLRQRLGEHAAADDLLDVAYRTVDSPVGALLLAATPAGLVRVAYATEGHEQVLQHLADRVSPRVLEAPARLDEPARELDAYFAGARRSFDVPLDLRLAGGFRRAVLDELRRIDYGRTRSYGQVAAGLGTQASRAVGTACAKNPLPIVVPCHRVVRSDGSVGEYVGGAAVKRTLLRLEGVDVGKTSGLTR
jgi:methylated-DNA-[protein]-cysteine S-methyltransferase